MGFGGGIKPGLSYGCHRYPQGLSKLLMADAGKKLVGCLPKIHRHLYAVRLTLRGNCITYCIQDQGRTEMNLSELSKLTEDEARELLERIRWPDGPVCAHCGATENIRKVKSEKRKGLYRCGECKKQFTVRVNTIMHDSHFPIRLWLMTFSIMCSAKKGISALQLQRQLGIGSYKCAWHLAHRVRYAMKQEPLKGLLTGTVMADETYVGGKPRRYGSTKTYKGGRRPFSSHNFGRGTAKTPVMALVEQGGRVRAHVITNASGKVLKASIREMVDQSATIMTDEWPGYRGIGNEFDGGHLTVNHAAGQYVRTEKGKKISTNEAEAFFALLKRGITGSFHSVSKKHLNRYCDEFSYRWSLRKATDAERTLNVIVNANGKRLTYRTPISDI